MRGCGQTSAGHTSLTVASLTAAPTAGLASVQADNRACPEKEDALRIQLVQTDVTTPAGGRPYSPALRAGDWLFISGQVASGPGGELVGRGDAEAQWRRCLENIRDLVEAADGSMADVVHTNIFVTDMRHHLAHSEIR